MRKAIFLVLFVATGIFIYNFFDETIEAGDGPANDNVLHYSIDPKTLIHKADRVGLNLGGWNNYGAEQFSKNIVMNPGFETTVDRILVTVKDAGPNYFSDFEGWGSPDGTWNNATFEVRTGKSSGFKGTIVASFEKGEKNLPQYKTHEDLPPLAVQDVILITKNEPQKQLSQWWFDTPPKVQNVTTVTGDVPPKSIGRQAAALRPTKGHDAELRSYIDHMAKKAGKLMLVNGQWELRFWMKKNGNPAHVKVEFKRLTPSPPFFETSIEVTDDWKEYVYKFDAQDNGKGETIMLKFNATGDGTQVLLDDVYLGPVQPNTTAFRQEAIDALKKLNPAYLREWQGQLGDSFENRIAKPSGRRPFLERVGGQHIYLYGYSLEEFLDLCKEIRANPWLIVPTSFTDEEYYRYGQYLAKMAPQERFSEVFVEFGNENWNWLFKPQAIPFPESHGELAEKAFQKILEGADHKSHIKTVVNGQHVNPELSRKFLINAPNAEYLAVAPYFFYQVNGGINPLENLRLLFSPDQGYMKELANLMVKLQKKLAVYEINMHSIQGNASGAERNAFVAGAASGAALAKHLLDNIALKVQPQMVFNFLQYEAGVDNGKEPVKLWGITRDIGETKRFRPTGLAVQMLNKVIHGSAHKILPDSGSKDTEPVTALAFRTATKWSAAFVNASPQAKEIELGFPQDNRSVPHKLLTLFSQSWNDTNEEKENVTIKSSLPLFEERVIRFTIPPWGFVVLPPQSTIPASSVIPRDI